MNLFDLLESSIYLFIFSISIFLGLLFFTKKSKNKEANLYLGLYLWTIAFSIANHILSHPISKEILGFSFDFIDPFMLILPLLFFYLIKTLNVKKNNWYFLIFLPGIVNSLFIPESGFLFFEFIIYLFEIGLIFFAIKMIKKLERRIQNFYSEIEKKSIQWLKYLFLLNFLIHSLIFCSELINTIQINSIIPESLIPLLFFVILMLILFWIGSNGFNQSEIFREKIFLMPNTGMKIEFKDGQNKVIQNIDLIKENTNKQTFQKEVEQFNDIKQKIEKLELYLDPTINLKSLAEKLGLKESELSHLINRCGNINFYLFINQFRVKKFKKLLTSPKAKQFSIIGLAHEAGFASKSTFYSTFKKIEGLTPKQYEQSLKKSE